MGAVAVEAAIAGTQGEAAAAVDAVEVRIEPVRVVEHFAFHPDNPLLGRVRNVGTEGLGLLRLRGRNERRAQVLTGERFAMGQNEGECQQHR